MVAGELLTALTLGLIGGVIPGPVIAGIFTEMLKSGFRKALRLVFIAFFIESLVAVVSLLAFSLPGLNEQVFRILSLAGAIVLLWIGVSVWRVRSLDLHQKVIFTPGKIILMILTNGVLWTYWITICIPRAMLLGGTVEMGEYLFMGLVQAGWLISTLILTYLFSNFRQVLSKPTIIPVAFKIFSAVFFYFAVDMVMKSIKFFFS